MHISEVFFKQKTLFWFLLLAILTGGVYAYVRMGKLEDPEIVIKQAMIVTVYPGASAHEVELNVSVPLENELRKQSGVSSISSESFPNFSKIMVEIAFSVPDREMEQRWDIMRRRVQTAAAMLPQGAMQPMVFDDVGDVYGMFYAMTADGYSPEEMERYARYVKQELLLVEGVRRIEVFGALQPCVNVTLSSEKMARLGVLPAQILLTLDGQNKPVFAGVFEGKDARLRLAVSDKIAELDDVRSLLIQSLSGEQIRLGDIATVERSYAEPRHNLFWLNNRDALGISISMEHGENIINVGKRVDERLAELKKNIPVGFAFDKIFFQPERVSNAIKGFMGNLASSVLIVVLALMLTMGFRGGMIIGCGLLLTVLATIPVLYALDGTLQRISLGAFIVAMGMLVDNAIVVLDGILVDSRRRVPLHTVLFATARKTAMPLLGATLIAVITFLPVFLSDDTAGIYARDLFLVLCISLLLSWLLALIQVPMFSSYFLKLKPSSVAPAVQNEGQDEVKDEVQNEEVYNHFAHRFVRRTLTLLLRHRAITLVASVVLLAAASMLFFSMKNRFFPDFDYEQAYIEYTLPSSASPSRVITDLHSITDYLLATGKVSRVAASHGRTPSRYCLVRSVNQGADSYGELIVDFHSYRELVKLKPQLEQALREMYPDAYIRIRQYNFTVKTSHAVEAQFSGPDPMALKELSRQAQDVMRACPSIDPATVCDNLEPPSLLLSAEYAQAAARRAGVSRSDLSNALLAATDGLPVGQLYEGETALPIYLRTRDAQGNRLTNINDVPVWTALPNFAGVDVSRASLLSLATGGAEAANELREKLISSTPLSSLTRGVKPTWEAGMVYRNNGRRAVEVQCDPLSGESAADARRAIRKQIESIPLPDGYAMQWKGEHELQHDALANMLGFIPLSAVLIVLILILLFGDLRKMAIVIFCLPFAAIGIAPAMVLTGQPFTFMAIIGVMGLAGMLIKNSIVLIDETTRLIREEGCNPHHAVVQASVARTRPVMMASLTTVLGMAPLVLDPMYCSLAVAVMSGLVVGTVVTLLLVPVFYGVFFRITN